MWCQPLFAGPLSTFRNLLNLKVRCIRNCIILLSANASPKVRQTASRISFNCKSTRVLCALSSLAGIFGAWSKRIKTKVDSGVAIWIFVAKNPLQNTYAYFSLFNWKSTRQYIQLIEMIVGAANGKKLPSYRVRCGTFCGKPFNLFINCLRNRLTFDQIHQPALESLHFISTHKWQTYQLHANRNHFADTV